MIHDNWLPDYYKRRPRIIQELKASYGNYQQITTALRLTRESYGLMQKQAAVIMDMTQSAISKLEMGFSDPPFITFIKYICILGYSMSIMRKQGDEDELSLFHIRRHEIAQTLPSDFNNSMAFPIFKLSEDAINQKASDIVRRLVEIRQLMEMGIDALCQEYTKIRKKPLEIDMPNLTIKQMANNLGVSHMTIRRFEQGAADGVTTGMVFRYAERLNIWLGLYENKSNREEKSWEHFALTCGMLHKTSETILADRRFMESM